MTEQTGKDTLENCSAAAFKELWHGLSAFCFSPRKQSGKSTRSITAEWMISYMRPTQSEKYCPMIFTANERRFLNRNAPFSPETALF